MRRPGRASPMWTAGAARLCEDGGVDIGIHFLNFTNPGGDADTDALRRDFPDLRG